jgi:RNA polymerase sigma factor (sigma-70 family)
VKAPIPIPADSPAISQAEWNRLYHSIVPILRSYAFKLIRSREDAEDVAEIVVGTLVRKTGRDGWECFGFDPAAGIDLAARSEAASKAWRWMFRVADNRARDVIRHREAVTLESDEELLESIALPPEPPKNPFEAEKDILRIQRALSRLKRKEMWLIALRFHLPTPFHDLASSRRISESAVRKRLSRAIAHLRELYDDELAMELGRPTAANNRMRAERAGLVPAAPRARGTRCARDGKTQKRRRT